MTTAEKAEGVSMTLDTMTDALVLTLGVAICTPLLVGRKSETFFAWAEALDAEARRENPDAPQLMKIIVPILRQLIMPSRAAMTWPEPYTKEQEAEFAGQVQRVHESLRRLWKTIASAGEQLAEREALAHADAATDAPASPADRPN